MSATIFLEGGAKDSKTLRISCRRAFRKLLEKMGVGSPWPRLIACGGRNEVYRQFCRQLANGGSTYVAMWIDSEEPLRDSNQTWRHVENLTTVSAWQKPPEARDDQLLFMTTSMETWIAADRAALRAHFEQGLNEKQLPTEDLESRSRAAVYNSLRQATQHCLVRYAKGEVAFSVFELLSPVALGTLPSFRRVQRILKSQLSFS